MRFKSDKKDVFTIPNFLSMFRLVLIPVIVIMYCKYRRYGLTVAVILVSGFTDIVDGWIARRFNMVSDLGKFLDPLADKLTQASVLLCLFTRFPHMIYLVILMVVKESLAGAAAVMGIKKSGQVHGAAWHGKLNTCVIYAFLMLHIIWYRIPADVSDILLIIVAAVMIFSLVGYVTDNIKLVRSSSNGEDK